MDEDEDDLSILLALQEQEEDEPPGREQGGGRGRGPPSPRPEYKAPPPARAAAQPPKPAAAAFSRPTSSKPSKALVAGREDTFQAGKCKVSGLIMRNRVISSLVVAERFASMAYIPLRAVKGADHVDDSTTWGTIVVLAEKQRPKQSATGQNFTVWKVTDLGGNPLTMVSLFLFGSAYNDLWKEDPGAAFMLTCPKIKHEDRGVSLSVDKGEQVQKLGTATSFGYCQGKRRDGGKCTMPVNLDSCEYCEFHVVAAFNKLRTSRLELSGGNLVQAMKKKIGRPGAGMQGLDGARGALSDRREARAGHEEMRQAAAQNLGRQTNSQGNRFLLGVASQREKELKAAAEAAASKRWGRPGGVVTPRSAPPGPAGRAGALRPGGGGQGGALAGASAAGMPRGGLGGALGGMARPAAGGGGALLTSRGLITGKLLTKQSTAQQRAAQRGPAGAGAGAGAGGVPGRGGAGHVHPGVPTKRQPDPAAAPARQMMALEDDDIFDDAPVAAAHARAAAVLARDRQQQRQPPSDPNDTRRVGVFAAGERRDSGVRPVARPGGAEPVREPSSKRKKPGALADVPINVAAGAGAGAGAGAPLPKAAAPPLGPAAKKPAAGLAALFSDVVGDVGAAAEARGSQYAQLSEDDKADQLDKSLAVLEKKDALSTKMGEVKEISVMASRCMVCEYTAERVKERCRELGHRIETVKGTKRFFECTKCRRRATAVDSKYPSRACSNCGGEHFKRVGLGNVADTKNDDVASKQNFRARGVEQAFSLKQALG